MIHDIFQRKDESPFSLLRIRFKSRQKCIKSQFPLTLKFLQVGTLFFQPIFLLQYLVHNLLSTYLLNKVTCKHDTISQKFRVSLPVPLHLILFIASRGP